MSVPCGCSKNKNNRLARIKALEKKNRTQKLVKKTIRVAVSRDKFAQAAKTKKLSICDKCPKSTQNKKEKKAGIKICHKTNRYTFALASDVKFKCPIGKF